MKIVNFWSAVVGALIGAIVAWLACSIYKSDESLIETGIWRVPGAAIWYQSFAESSPDKFTNEFRARKLCGDTHKPCSPWRKIAAIPSDRPYPVKDVEVHEGGGKLLIQLPDGHAIKGEADENWIVEKP